MKKKNICVVTGSRAEYGLLNPLIEEITKDDCLNLQIVATGMHLSPEFGLTYKEIEEDGFKIDEKVEILLSSDTPAGISKSIGLAVISFSEVFAKLNPDLLVVLGDRYEILGVVTVALINKIPVAHISGGEITEGAYDDSIRNAITKMSHLHFPSTEEYRKRIIQMGESPERVFNVGALGIDNIKRLKLLDRQEIQKELKLKFSRRNLLITIHPATLDEELPENGFQKLLSVIDELEDTTLIFTKTNADVGGRSINLIIDKYVEANSDKAYGFVSLGYFKYLSLLQYVDCVIGNSSSGIVEAPSFKIGTINIGDRQKGRVKAESVIDCGCSPNEIRNAVEMLYSDNYQKKLKTTTNPYDGDKTALKIKNIIRDFNYIGVLKKGFYNIQFEC